MSSGRHHGGHHHANYYDNRDMNYGPGSNMGPPNMNYGGQPQMPPPNMGYYGNQPQMPPPNMGYYGNQPQPPPPNMSYGGPPNLRRKALLIGINYTGSRHALQGCQQDVQNVERFLASRGFPTDQGSMAILTDARGGPFYPTGRNILAAMDWLVSEPNCNLFLHYSGHGGQVRDPDGDRDSGYDDTIVPVDFEQNGQINSDMLHRRLVSRLHPSSTLFVLFDCCHSGSAIELPYVYHCDEDGNVNLANTMKQGMGLMTTASHLIQGGFTMEKVSEARDLMTSATTFFRSLSHLGEAQEDGLGEEQFREDWKRERKSVFMYSGCRDDQTSADATINGAHVGAMSWAFLTVMGGNPNQSYIQVLRNTRGLLQDRYSQIPQLSVGSMVDLNQPLHI